MSTSEIADQPRPATKPRTLSAGRRQSALRSRSGANTKGVTVGEQLSVVAPTKDAKSRGLPAPRQTSASRPRTSTTTKLESVGEQQPLSGTAHLAHESHGALGGAAEHDLSDYRTLKTWAEMFYDSQEMRKRTANRIRNAPVISELFAEELAIAVANEHRLGLNLVRQYRATAPAGVIKWQKANKGIGAHLLARLLGHLGHPRIATPSHWEGSGEDRKLIADEPYERTLAQLRQYAGHGSPGKPPSGTKDFEQWAKCGSPKLKMLVHLLSEQVLKEPGKSIKDLLDTIAGPPSEGTNPIPASAVRCNSAQQPRGSTNSKLLSVAEQRFSQPNSRTDTMTFAAGNNNGKSRSPVEQPQPTQAAATWTYRLIYEKRRIATLDRTHAEVCVRCGPSGKPAQPGSPWSKAHAHADALRIVGKAILSDLWTAAGE